MCTRTRIPTLNSHLRLFEHAGTKYHGGVLPFAFNDVFSRVFWPYYAVQVHVLLVCAWSSAGAQAGACARAGAGVRLLQHSFRCLSATITVGTAYFSPPWFFESYELQVFFFCVFFQYWPSLIWDFGLGYELISRLYRVGRLKGLFPFTATTRLSYQNSTSWWTQVFMTIQLS